MSENKTDSPATPGRKGQGTAGQNWTEAPAAAGLGRYPHDAGATSGLPTAPPQEPEPSEAVPKVPASVPPVDPDASGAV